MEREKEKRGEGGGMGRVIERKRENTEESPSAFLMEGSASRAAWYVAFVSACVPFRERERERERCTLPVTDAY